MAGHFLLWVISGVEEHTIECVNNVLINTYRYTFLQYKVTNSSLTAKVADSVSCVYNSAWCHSVNDVITVKS